MSQVDTELDAYALRNHAQNLASADAIQHLSGQALRDLIEAQERLAAIIRKVESRQ